MKYEFCQLEREGPLTIITLNRPEVLNALHPAANDELAHVFDNFAQDPDQWVAIITGAGRAFCTGSDLTYQAAGNTMRWPPSGFAGLTSRFDLDKPLIAAVNGPAMGGGFETALACDLIIASDKAQFALPEPKVGLAARAGGLHRLPQQIGLKHALGIILTGRTVSAEEAKTLGLVNEVVSHDQLMKAARDWANRILALSPMAVRAAKQTLYRGQTEPSLAAALSNQHTYPALKAMYESEDCMEGPRAFAEKRPPRWKGK